jgi:purine-binding chemotaxis protein CheW
MNVLVRSDGGVESLLVDEIGEVVEVDQEVFESPPCTLQGIASEMVRGVYKLPEHLLLVLDVNRVANLGTNKTAEFGATGTKKN